LPQPSRLGHNVKELREKAGLTLRGLATRAGISHATLSRLESGRVQDISAVHLGGLADALNIPADTLLNRRPPLYTSRLLNDVIDKVRMETLAGLDLDTVLDTMAEKFLRQGRFRSVCLSLVRPEEGIFEVVRNYNCVDPKGVDSPGHNIRISTHWMRKEVLENGEIVNIDEEEVIGRKIPLDHLEDMGAKTIRTKHMLTFDGYGRSCHAQPIEGSDDNLRKIAYMIPLRYEDEVIGLLATGSQPQEYTHTVARIEAIQPLLNEFTILLKAALTTHPQSQPHLIPLPDILPAFLHERGRILRVNHALASRFQDADHLFVDASVASRLAHPRHRKLIQQLPTGTFRNGSVVIWRTKDGSVFPGRLFEGPTRSDQTSQKVRIGYICDVSELLVRNAADRLHWHFLELSGDLDLPPLLRAIHSEVEGFGLSPVGVSINTFDEQHRRGRRRAWLQNRHYLDDELDLETPNADRTALLTHWRRREDYDRRPDENTRTHWRQVFTDLDYAPQRLVDVPFHQGTLGLAFADRAHFTQLIGFLHQIATRLQRRFDQLSQQAPLQAPGTDSLFERIYYTILSMQSKDDLWQVLRALGSELEGIDLPVTGLSTILFFEKEGSFENYYLREEITDHFQAPIASIQSEEGRKLLNCWRRNETYSRAPHADRLERAGRRFELEKADPSAWTIDVPFSLGMLGLSLTTRPGSQPHGLLTGVARLLDLGLRRFL
jgi:transcriptional regulator with XRE-family HTH domain